MDSPVEWADGCELSEVQEAEVIRRLQPSLVGVIKALLGLRSHQRITDTGC